MSWSVCKLKYKRHTWYTHLGLRWLISWVTWFCLLQDIDIEKLVSEVKLLKDTVKAQERKIKHLEEKVAEFEKTHKSDESDDDNNEDEIEDEDEEQNHHGNGNRKLA